MSLTFIHLSDTHLGADKTFLARENNPYERCQAVIRKIQTLPYQIDFILHSGDVANRSDLGASGAYELAGELFGALKKWPVYYLVGNHDDAREMKARLPFPQVEWLSERLDYRFECKGFSVLALNVRKSENAEGVLSEEQFGYVEQLLSQRKKCLLFLHIPPVDLGVPWYRQFTGSHGKDSMLISNGEKLHGLLSAKDAVSGVQGVFFGHIHASHTVVRDGILYSGVTSTAFQFLADAEQTEVVWDLATPPGFQVVHMDSFGVRVTPVRL